MLGAATSVQFGAALAATLFDQLGPGGTVWLRLVLASVILIAIWRPRLSHRSRRELLLVVAFGLALAAMNTGFYEALDRIPLGITVTIEFAGPLGLAVALSRRPLDAVWVVLAAGGIVLLARGSSGGLDGVGVAFALVAGVAWAVYILLSSRVGKTWESGTGLAVAMTVGAIVTTPLGIADGGGDLLHPALLAQGAAVAVLSSAIPYSLELEALRRIPAGVFGVLMSLEPALAALAGFIVLGQDLVARELVGIAAVVVASAGAARTARRPTVVD
ncbi:MAG TPA: EamA family transporter [Solirubrobacteraceae bacterium]|nr:EamA family transporter [Solirubrobacteraceae bacterium]